MSKKIILMLSAVVLVAAVTVGATYAYLTTATRHTDVVEIGNVDVTLERITQKSTGENQAILLIPNVTIEADTYRIHNVGTNRAYIRVKLELSGDSKDWIEPVGGDRTGSQDDPDQGKVQLGVTYSDQELDWKELDGYYYYKTPVEIGETLDLKTTITLPAWFDPEVQGTPEKIDIVATADAIQEQYIALGTDNFPVWNYTDGDTESIEIQKYEGEKQDQPK